MRTGEKERELKGKRVIDNKERNKERMQRCKVRVYILPEDIWPMQKLNSLLIFKFISTFCKT